jgi:hypothetical protein
MIAILNIVYSSENWQRSSAAKKDVTPAEAGVQKSWKTGFPPARE